MFMSLSLGQHFLRSAPVYSPTEGVASHLIHPLEPPLTHANACVITKETTPIMIYITHVSRPWLPSLHVYTLLHVTSYQQGSCMCSLPDAITATIYPTNHIPEIQVPDSGAQRAGTATCTK
jgi:hypothetical protein